MTGGITTLKYLDANREEDEQGDGIFNGILAAEQEKEKGLPSQAKALTPDPAGEPYDIEGVNLYFVEKCTVALPSIRESEPSYPSNPSSSCAQTKGHIYINAPSFF